MANRRPKNATSRPAKRRARIVEGQESVALSKAQFLERFRERHADSAFERTRTELDALGEVAWDGYHVYRKDLATRKAGKAFAIPSYDLPVEWLDTRRAIHAAERKQRDRRTRSRILVINGSPRSDQTCSGEVSKSWRLCKHVEKVVTAQPRFEVDFLDLSRLTSEYGRVIHPCKACVSTAQPLCHWP